MALPPFDFLREKQLKRKKAQNNTNIAILLTNLTIFKRALRRHPLKDPRKTRILKRKTNRNRMEGFVYVVNPPEIPRVAFGSSLDRVTLPLRGPCLTSFMRQHQGDVYLSPGPTARVDERDYLQLRWPSKLGFSALANKTPRLPPPPNSNFPCVGSYDVVPKKPFRKAHKPFNVGAARKDKEQFLTPAPPTYPHHLARPQLQLSTAFGSKRKIKPAVRVICTSLNMAKCCKCERTPIGDYWHDFNTDMDLCRPCMHRLESDLKSCTTTEMQRLRLRREFADYKPVRYCDFYHDHGGTTAAIQVMPSRVYNLKVKKENYLALYM